MPRCDYDAVFYRVFCITLLAIAFTFTIILTNVFVDIDGLLSKKEKGKHIGVTEKIRSILVQNDFTTETTYNNEMIFEETEDSYRNKRSIESQNFLFHIENPKFKNDLKKKLANLLADFDDAETLDKFEEKKVRPREEHKAKVVDRKNNKESEMLHLAMHNVILQGIVGHMDLKEVYKRIHNLITNFKKEHRQVEESNGKTAASSYEEAKPLWKTDLHRGSEAPIEDNLFEEIINCKDLENQIVDDTKDDRRDDRRLNSIDQDGNVFIKTLIDITTLANGKPQKENQSKSNENIKGVIKLVYNGKNIKFTRLTDETTHTPPKTTVTKIKDIIRSYNTEVPNPAYNTPRGIWYDRYNTEKVTIKPSNKTKPKAYDYKSIPQSYMNQFVEEYFKRFAVKDNESTDKSKETKRIKRDIKVKYDNNEKQDENAKLKGKTDDDELYVEIETHFDSKGMKGEKKKKLIRNLIQKIQKAIHSDMEEDKKKKHKNLHVKKRIQNPLENKSKLLISKITTPLNDVIHRQINPITKLDPFPETYAVERSAESWKKGNVDYVSNKSGETWKRGYSGPGFLTVGKAMNSAELSEVDVDYSKVLNINGIPQRLQKPLNYGSSDEQANTYYDFGNMKFFMKDVDGSGFSIGFNQYIDEPPDTETMKLFTGLENIINTYHQTYDHNEQSTEPPVPKIDLEEKYQESSHDDSKADEHIVVRRSIKENHDYHSNEYRIIFENNFLPYESYKEIYDKPKQNYQDEEVKKIKKSTPFIIDEDIFNKSLKPAEIFGLANLFQRKKRSVNVKKISNLKSKMKLNRFLNTHAMPTKRVYINKKRNKRQINKIRIIATDLPHVHRHSDENIYVVSDENIFADRAIVRDMEMPQSDIEEYQKKPDEQYEYIPEEEIPSTQADNLFNGKSRHNALTSKYPHIFMEEISKSKEEEFGLDYTFLFRKLFEHDQDIERRNGNIVNMDPIPLNTTELPQKYEDVLNSLAPPKSNIKVTVKVLPKNGTGLNSGFKEVHTSINKSYNKNGLLYSSLVNVSEISKIIKLNKTVDNSTDHKDSETELSQTIKEQQEKMQYLLRQHKEHLDEQLEQLNAEKNRLEAMLQGSNSTYGVPKSNFIELVMPSNPNQIILVSKDKMQEIASTSLLKNATITTIGTTPKPTILSTTPISDNIKNKMIHSIERNENLTYQILDKIDKNTQILEKFLVKLTDSIAKPAPPSTENIWNNQALNFDPNTMINKNGSHVSIPFVYAYQQSILPHKEDKVASVLYHGHIHTNALPDRNFKKLEEKEKVSNYITPGLNQTRFFIDDLENDYKVASVRDRKKAPIGNNTL